MNTSFSTVWYLLSINKSYENSIISTM